MASWLAAAVQMTSTEDVAGNLARAGALVARAVARGAGLVTLPENFAWLRISGPDPAEVLDERAPGPILRFGLEAAARHGVWLLLGSVPEAGGPELGGRIYNTSVLVAPTGRVAAVYRKIHLFDVAIPGGAEVRESDRFAPGSEPVLADTALGPIGLTICYDLRFPELYRALVARGARVLCVPSAFTAHTGKDHWEVLLRARAIENQCWVVAAAQYGHHGANRRSFGHAMIVDPWGAVLACAPDREDVAVAEIDYARQDEIRQQLPCLGHRRL
jgi:predicted amidohydrolase